MFYWIYDLPTPLAAMGFALAFVLFNVVGVYFVRPLIRPLVAELSDENNLIGSVLSLYSVMYGLLMGTIAVVAYQNLADAQSIVEAEASAIAALYRDVSAYPEPERTELQSAVNQYTAYVIKDAWPLQQRGEIPTGGVALTTNIQAPLHKFEPKTPGQEAFHAETLRQYNTFVVNRRLRLSAVNNAIPPILWSTMAAGSALLLVLMWLWDASRKALLVLSGIAAFALGSMFGLIALMDHPFRGSISVSADPYQLVYDQLMKK